MSVLNIRISNGFGGAEKYILYLFNRPQNKFPEILHLTNNKLLYKYLSKINCRVLNFEYEIEEVGTKKEIVKLIISIVTYFKAYKKIIRVANINNANVIILHSITEKILLTWVLKILSHKVVWFEHGPLFVTKSSLLIKFLYKYSSKYVDRIFAVSKGTYKDLLANGISKNKLATCYIGIDTNYYKNDSLKALIFKEKTGIIPNKRCIGYLGNLNAEKGITRFIEIAEELVKAGNDYQFLIIGDGPLYDSLTQKYSLPNFVFTGFIENVKDYLNILDVMILPTEHFEGISIAILESMSMGVCVITKDIGGNKEIIIDNTNGILYKDFNKTEIVNRIAKLFKDKKRMSCIKINARKTIVDKFSLDVSQHKFEKELRILSI